MNDKKYILEKKQLDDVYKKNMLRLSDNYQINLNRKEYRTGKQQVDAQYDKNLNKLKKKYKIKHILITPLPNDFNLVTRWDK